MSDDDTMSVDTMPDDTVPTSDDTYYGALLNAWLTSRFEHDKMLVTLSSAGVGILVSLLTAVGPRTSLDLGLYFLSFLGFVVSIIVALNIFRKNSSHVERIIQGSSEPNPSLEVLDRLLRLSFLLGLVSTVLIGVVAGVHSNLSS